MTKIEKLTKEQTARFPAYVREWTAIGLETAPADMPRAEAAIRWMYDRASLAPPRIVWCSSPLAMCLTQAILEDKKFGASVGASVRDSVGDSVGASVRASVRASVYGQHDVNWLAFYRYFADECGLKGQTEKLSGLWGLCHSAGWAIPHENICWVSERHCVLERDDRGRLHSIIGPACAYPDGWGIYAVHGVRVPEYIVMKPNKITTKAIDDESNAEIRRIMIDRYGLSRYVTDSGAKTIHELPENYFVKGLRTARLLVKEVRDDEPIVMLDMLNSTPEPDGTTRRYLLRVDPKAYDGEAGRNCTAAMASTWRNDDGSLVFKKPAHYKPIFES